jgi:hypothetical protein
MVSSTNFRFIAEGRRKKEEGRRKKIKFFAIKNVNAPINDINHKVIISQMLIIMP